jgi:hypothetical protein
MSVSRHLDRVILMVGIVSAAAAVMFLGRSVGYYTLPLWDRPDSPLHEALRPSGSLGHPFAWVGASVMLVGVLLYSTRKRFAPMRGRGPMRTWLNLHIYLCLSGPFLVALHTAGKLRGLGVYSFWSMVIVAASGIIGRWIYQQFPRTIKGELMSLDDIRQEQEDRRARLASDFGLGPAQLAAIDAETQRSVGRIRQGTGGGLGALPLLLLDDVARPFRIARLRRRLRKERRLARREAKTIFDLIGRQVATARKVAFLDTFRSLFGYWHVVHLVFFAAMLVLLVLHVASEAFFGVPLVGT